MKSSSPASRRKTAAESFRTAADCIGSDLKDLSLFAITRGQFSMIDAVRHILSITGPARLTIWTWTIAEYEIEVFRGLMGDGNIAGGTLVIDYGARNKNAHLIAEWKAVFGPDSVRYVVNHAKMATVEGGGYKVLLRGSLNLNYNPRFEQLDVTEGGPDFDLVQTIEAELPILPDDCTGEQCGEAARVNNAFGKDQLAMFRGVRVWKK